MIRTIVADKTTAVHAAQAMCMNKAIEPAD